MVGLRQDFTHDEMVTPFALGLAGLTYARGESGTSSSRFALGFGGGVRIMPPDGHIGLRLDGVE